MWPQRKVYDVQKVALKYDKVNKWIEIAFICAGWFCGTLRIDHGFVKNENERSKIGLGRSLGPPRKKKVLHNQIKISDFFFFLSLFVKHRFI